MKDVASLILYPTLTAFLFYLGSRAMITAWLWSRYPKRVASFFDCAACSGTWYGFLTAAIIGTHYNLPFLSLPPDDWPTWVIAGACSGVWNVFAAALHQHGMASLGSAIPEDPQG